MTREEQIQFIQDNYLSLPVRVMARQLGRSRCFVMGVMKREGLVVPDSIRKKHIQISQFRKGQESFNKGKKQNEYMSPEQIERSKKTRFKKGQLPHNTRYDGHISIRKMEGRNYAWIRVELGKYRLLHRMVYEQAFGKIPKGSNVQFKDGNTLNCNPDNLYLLSRSKQARINKLGGNKIPYELQQSILLVQDLNMKINEKQDRRSKQPSIQRARAAE